MELTLTEKLILVATGLLLWGGHHFPWRIIPWLVNEKGDLYRVPAYIYGVGCILAGLAAWCAHLGDWSWFWPVGLLAAAAGIGTILPRVVKHEAESQARRADNRDLEQLIEKLERQVEEKERMLVEAERMIRDLERNRRDHEQTVQG